MYTLMCVSTNISACRITHHVLTYLLRYLYLRMYVYIILYICTYVYVYYVCYHCLFIFVHVKSTLCMYVRTSPHPQAFKNYLISHPMEQPCHSYLCNAYFYQRLKHMCCFNKVYTVYSVCNGMWLLLFLPSLTTEQG